MKKEKYKKMPFKEIIKNQKLEDFGEVSEEHFEDEGN